MHTTSLETRDHYIYPGFTARGILIYSVLEAAGAKLRYLPAYSPDFNPIEQFFAKLKVPPRKAAARTVEALITAIAEALNRYVSPHECENYLANQGYRRQS